MAEILILDPKQFSPVRAAQYIRMSTEHQRYSPENQSDVIRRYAEMLDIEIVRTYSDLGRSGLTMSKRSGLRTLLDDVDKRRHDFSVLLVYDVSRWGRFQDADESAYYEYVCTRANVRVHYCAEQFENDGSFSSTLLKTIKRSMAAEYSRELSVRVFAGQSRLVELGFWQGGTAGFGLRRLLVGLDGSIKQVLAYGERKNIQSDRVILIPGPEQEVELVRKIFDLYTVEGMGIKKITKFLNERGVQPERGSRWNKDVVYGLLTNPKYVGSNVYNRRSFKLSKKLVRNPTNMWIRRDGAFEAIVPLEQFLKTQRIMRSRSAYPSDEEMLEHLRRLRSRVGRLSTDLINDEIGVPSVSSYTRRFNTLNHVYSLIGYRPDLKNRYESSIARHRSLRRELYLAIKNKLRSSGASVEDCGSESRLLINGHFTACLRLCYCKNTEAGSYSWALRPESSRPDVTIAVRLRPGNQDILDYFLIPDVNRVAKTIYLWKENRCDMEVHRFDNLDLFVGLLKQSTLEENT